MATTDKTTNSAERPKAKVEEAPGKATGNDKLRVEGKSQMKDNLKQAGYTR